MYALVAIDGQSKKKKLSKSGNKYCQDLFGTNNGIRLDN